MEAFTMPELDMLITSMEYTQTKFRDTGVEPYGPYPSYEFKQQREAEAHAVITKLRALRRALKCKK